MSLAPKDEHEAQIQFALERGIPAFSSVMGTQRLVFPSNVYDVVHCARCRVPWEIEGEPIPVVNLFANLSFTQLGFTTGICLKEFYDFRVAF